MVVVVVGGAGVVVSPSPGADPGDSGSGPASNNYESEFLKKI